MEEHCRKSVIQRYTQRLYGKVDDLHVTLISEIFTNMSTA